MFGYAALRRIFVGFLVATAPVLAAASVAVNGTSTTFDDCACTCASTLPPPPPNDPVPPPPPPSPLPYYADPYWDSPEPGPRPTACPYAAGSVVRCPKGEIFASDGATLYHLSPEGYAALGTRMYTDYSCTDFDSCGAGPVITADNAGILKKFFGLGRRMLRSGPQ